MLIKFHDNYKSIKSLNSGELPDFTIITGVNGAGKSHLLQGLNNGHISIHSNNKRLQLLKSFKNTNMAPTTYGGHVDGQDMERVTNDACEKLRRYKEKLNTSALGKDMKVFTDISNQVGKEIKDLSNNDVVQNYPIKDNSMSDDAFQQNFSREFKRYHIKLENNEFDEFKFKKHGQGTFLSNSEFLKRNGPPPWDLVNEILISHKLPYRINNPLGTRKETPFKAILWDTRKEIEIQFSDLSSGENVLMCMILSLYNLNSSTNWPEVLLMDEPDSSLHPAMIEKFLKIIKEIFVDMLGIKVIMSTHSPSTVALAPDESIHVLTPDPHELKKIPKDQAISVLTSGVPTLSVSYENRRQIFVESKYDQILYEKIDSILSKNSPSKVSLHFLCTTINGNSDCNQVMEIVGKLNSFGNKQIYGIIDWDLNNKPKENTIILGNSRRYSIENYIFDPLILGIYLIRERFIDDATKYGLEKNEQYIDISNFDTQRLQQIIDKVVEDLSKKLELDPKENLVNYSSKSNHTFSVPNWYLHMQGHELEENIKETYHKLKKFKQEGALKLDIVEKVYLDLPGMIPLEVVETLELIRNAN